MAASTSTSSDGPKLITCEGDSDCKGDGNYCMKDPTKTKPYTCHGAKPASGAASSAACVGRATAERGDEVWCKCNIDKEVIGADGVTGPARCVDGGGGRVDMCAWDPATKVCKPSKKETTTLKVLAGQIKSALGNNGDVKVLVTGQQTSMLRALLEELKTASPEAKFEVATCDAPYNTKKFDKECKGDGPPCHRVEQAVPNATCFTHVKIDVPLFTPAPAAAVCDMFNNDTQHFPQGSGNKFKGFPRIDGKAGHLKFIWQNKTFKKLNFLMDDLCKWSEGKGGCSVGAAAVGTAAGTAAAAAHLKLFKTIAVLFYMGPETESGLKDCKTLLDKAKIWIQNAFKGEAKTVIEYVEEHRKHIHTAPEWIEFVKYALKTAGAAHFDDTWVNHLNSGGFNAKDSWLMSQFGMTEADAQTLMDTEHTMEDDGTGSPEKNVGLGLRWANKLVAAGYQAAYVCDTLTAMSYMTGKTDPNDYKKTVEQRVELVKGFAKHVLDGGAMKNAVHVLVHDGEPDDLTALQAVSAANPDVVVVFQKAPSVTERAATVIEDGPGAKEKGARSFTFVDPDSMNGEKVNGGIPLPPIPIPDTTTTTTAPPVPPTSTVSGATPKKCALCVYWDHLHGECQRKSGATGSKKMCAFAAACREINKERPRDKKGYCKPYGTTQVRTRSEEGHAKGGRRRADNVGEEVLPAICDTVLCVVNDKTLILMCSIIYVPLLLLLLSSSLFISPPLLSSPPLSSRTP